MLQNTLDGIMEFCCVRTVAQQTGHTPNSANPYSFAEYLALLITTAESYDTEWSAKRCPICSANLHGTSDLTYDETYQYDDGYDIDTSIDTIYANAASSRQVIVPTDWYGQLSLDGKKLWASLTDADCQILVQLDSASTSTLTDSPASSRGGFQGGFQG